MTEGLANKMLIAMWAEIRFCVAATAQIGNDRLAIEVNDDIADIVLVVHFLVVTALRGQHRFLDETLHFLYKTFGMSMTLSLFCSFVFRKFRFFPRTSAKSPGIAVSFSIF